MPSTQSPPAIGLATDPTAVRPPLDDALIERVEASQVYARLQQLKSDGFTMLLDLGAADYPERALRFDVVYHLLKMPLAAATAKEVARPQRLRVLCAVGGESPVLPTACGLWASADWAEREVFDLFGIRFEGHPDLRRIQMPNDWEGYPLRKDYPLRGPAREKSPRPAFGLKSNVVAGTPPSGKTLEALQSQLAKARAGNGGGS